MNNIQHVIYNVLFIPTISYNLYTESVIGYISRQISKRLVLRNFKFYTS